jgi:hypothetical protein
LGLAFIAASVVGLLLIARLLGAALIALPPLAAVVLIVALVRWRVARRAARMTPPPMPPADAGPASGPVAAGAALVLLLAAGSAQAMGTPPAPVGGGVTLESAVYSGIVTDRVAELDAVLTVFAPVVPPGGVRVPLFGDDVAVAEFSAEARGGAALVREGPGVVLHLTQPGRTAVKLRLVATPAGDVTRRSLAFRPPQALASRLSLVIAEPEAAVEVPDAVFYRVPKEEGSSVTRVEATFGAAERLDVRWTPRVKRAAEIAATVFCQNATLLRIGGGVLQARTRLEYQVAQGEVRELRVRVPAGQRLLRVEGEGIRTWQTRDEPGGAALTVELFAPATAACALTVETERPLGALPATVPVEVPHALDVSRETGFVGLQPAEDVAAAAARMEGIQKVDVEEFAAAAAGLGAQGGAGTAYRFAKPGFELGLTVEAVRPQLEAVANCQTLVGSESLRVAAKLDYQIRKAGVFALRVGLPAGYTVTDVSGEKIAQWAETTEDGRRVLEVRLKERVLGAYTLRLGLYQWLKGTPKTVEIAGVHPLGVQKLTGYLKASAELGVQLKAQSAEGLTEVPAATVPDLLGGGVLAYKFVDDDPAEKPGWSLALGTESVESWVRCEVVNWLTLDPTEAGLAHGRAVLRYEVQNAPVKEFRIRPPAGARSVDVRGESIRRRDQEEDLWRVELQSKVSGAYVLTVQWEQPFDAQAGQLEIAGVQALGAERETGAFAIQAQPPLQVSEKAVGGDLVRADTREIPEWAGRPDASTVLAFRYLRPGGRVTLAVRRFENAEVLNAMVEQAVLTSVVSEDGQMMTRAALTVRNNARQYLEIALPAGSTVWSALVDGTAVQPTEREGRLLLPLQRTESGAATVAVELTYVGAVVFPPRRKAVAFVSPALDVPVKDARWDLYLPPGFDYGGFRGTMTYEPEAREQRPSVMSFSLDDYVSWEGKRVTAQKAKVSRVLKKAQEELSQQKLKDVNQMVEQVQMEAERDADSQSAVETIGKQLRKAQAWNVLNAQRTFASNYKAGQGGEGEVQQDDGVAQAGEPLDEEVAAVQWERVRQAQELGVTQVRPLHVNLPSRGLHYAFSQALQTRVGEPLTVELRAASARGISLPLGVLLGGGGFLALWVVCAWVMGVRRAEP